MPVLTDIPRPCPLLLVCSLLIGRPLSVACFLSSFAGCPCLAPHAQVMGPQEAPVSGHSPRYSYSTALPLPKHADCAREVEYCSPMFFDSPSPILIFLTEMATESHSSLTPAALCTETDLKVFFFPSLP